MFLRTFRNITCHFDLFVFDVALGSKDKLPRIWRTPNIYPSYEYSTAKYNLEYIFHVVKN